MWQSADRERVGLVVLFPGSVRGHWDPAVCAFVDNVEESLDNVFVTHAASSGDGPSLVDAVAASRFAGCTSIVVTALGGGPELAAGTGWAVPCSVIGTARDPEAVVRAFRKATDPADRSAPTVRCA